MPTQLGRTDLPQVSGGSAIRRSPLCSYNAKLALTLIVGLVLGTLLLVTRGHLGAPFGTDGLSLERPLPVLARPSCGVSTKLVPTCGRWWGIAPLAHTTVPVQAALWDEESAIGRPLDIVHVYHTNDQLFPTSTERSLATENGRNRLLLINWKPATDMPWRAVASGRADARIDRLAAYLKANWRHRFFLDVWHEPENDVIARAGSGMTAADYAAMYRHVVLRLRGDGVTWAVTVMNYMGFDKWALQPWFSQLWPGDDVVDWIGLDPYGTGATSGYNARDFATLINRPQGSFPGYYTWATTRHAGKPIMLAEWGVQAVSSNPGGQAAFFATVRSSLARYPKLKALVYFDMPTPPAGQPRTYLRANSRAQSAFQTLSRSPLIVAPRVPRT